jgi:hypothetical protein
MFLMLSDRECLLLDPYTPSAAVGSEWLLIKIPISLAILEAMLQLAKRKPA